MGTSANITPGNFDAMVDALKTKELGTLIGIALETGLVKFSLTILDKFPNAKFIPGKRPWEVKADLYMPCAMQNDITLDWAKAMVANGARYLIEGANMPTTNEAGPLFFLSPCTWKIRRA